VAAVAVGEEHLQLVAVVAVVARHLYPQEEPLVQQ
jgi:hypothetical protein